jgi:peptidyl-prolyl cis-trans isomerase C
MRVGVNGVPVDAGRWPSVKVAAVRELLRQRAVARSFLSADADNDDEIGLAIEGLLAEEVQIPEPSEEECRRYYDAHHKEFRSGDLVHARHVLFQVTPGVDVAQLRARAEQTLAELLREPGRFGAIACELSNCPSGQQGGNLGQIGRGDAVPEFEQALFRPSPPGILREVVRTRYGFHLVAIHKRIPGETLPFEVVKEHIAQRLKMNVEAQALRQYVLILAGQAEIAGVDLKGAQTPLVQ